MNRRQFLLSSAAACVSGPALAQMKMMDHDMSGMGGIDFRNAIPNQPSTIHWHGMPVPADQDGNPMNAVASGDGRTYEFVLPDGSAASYWYHPHPHALSAEQVYRGLAGPFLVKPKI